MSTNALLDSLECYMDDLVDSFEDFIKKSLILVTVAIGTVVAVFLYMMKTMTERTETFSVPLTFSDISRPSPLQSHSRPSNIVRVSDASIQSKSLQDIVGTKNRQSSTNDHILYEDNKGKNTYTSISNTAPLTNLKCSNESIGNKSQSKFFNSPQVPKCEQGSACNPAELKKIGKTLSSRIEISSINTLIAMKPRCDDCATWGNALLRSMSAPKVAKLHSANCMPRHHLSTSRPCSRLIPVRTSCCSMCCADDDRR